MLGSIIGDIVGSRFEWDNIKTKNFELFTRKNQYTDDSVMTLAIAQAIMSSTISFDDLSSNAIKEMQELGRNDADRGYGYHFQQWLFDDTPQPYNSWGNGAAMRVSPCGLWAKNLQEAEDLAIAVTKVSHNHEEGIKGAVVVAGCTFLAQNGHSKDCIRDYANKFYDVNFYLDDIRDSYKFDVSCQGSVPQAIVAFLEAKDFEDAIRGAVSIGGDSDTIAAITGGIAEAYYGIPEEIKNEALQYLPNVYKKILQLFYNKIENRI